MPADLKLKRKLKRTPASERMKTKRALKKWARGAAGKRYERIMKDPVKRLKHLRTVTIPKYKAWIKAAKAELKTAKGPQKAEVKRKLENHVIRLKMARAELAKQQKANKAKTK